MQAPSSSSSAYSHRHRSSPVLGRHDSARFQRDRERDRKREKPRSRTRERARRPATPTSRDMALPGRPPEKLEELPDVRVRQAGPWSEQFSSSGKRYFYNGETEVSTWHKPDVWIEEEVRLEQEMKEKARDEERRRAGLDTCRERHDSEQANASSPDDNMDIEGESSDMDIDSDPLSNLPPPPPPPQEAAPSPEEPKALSPKEELEQRLARWPPGQKWREFYNPDVAKEMGISIQSIFHNSDDEELGDIPMTTKEEKMQEIEDAVRFDYKRSVMWREMMRLRVKRSLQMMRFEFKECQRLTKKRLTQLHEEKWHEWIYSKNFEQRHMEALDQFRLDPSQPPPPHYIPLRQRKIKAKNRLGKILHKHPLSPAISRRKKLRLKREADAQLAEAAASLSKEEGTPTSLPPPPPPPRHLKNTTPSKNRSPSKSSSTSNPTNHPNSSQSSRHHNASAEKASGSKSQRERDREREKEKEKERQKKREKERQREREKQKAKQKAKMAAKAMRLPPPPPPLLPPPPPPPYPNPEAVTPTTVNTPTMSTPTVTLSSVPPPPPRYSDHYSPSSVISSNDTLHSSSNFHPATTSHCNPSPKPSFPSLASAGSIKPIELNLASVSLSGSPVVRYDSSNLPIPPPPPRPSDNSEYSRKGSNSSGSSFGNRTIRPLHSYPRPVSPVPPPMMLPPVPPPSLVLPPPPPPPSLMFSMMPPVPPDHLRIAPPPIAPILPHSLYYQPPPHYSRHN